MCFCPLCAIATDIQVPGICSKSQMTSTWYHVSTQQEFSQIPATSTPVNLYFHQMMISHWFGFHADPSLNLSAYDEIVFDKCHFLDSVLDDLWVNNCVTFIACTQHNPDMFAGEVINGALRMHCTDMDFRDPKCLKIHRPSTTAQFYYDYFLFVRCVITQDMVDSIQIDGVEFRDCVFEATNMDSWKEPLGTNSEEKTADPPIVDATQACIPNKKG